MIKRLGIFLGVLMLTLNTVMLTVKADMSAPVPSADSAVLMNGITGEIIYSKNPDGSYPPASTTKILTTLLAFENCNLDDIVTVGKNPPNAEGSSIALLADEQASVRDLLYGLNLQSGNDCADALAEHISGTKEKFAALMNERAKQLGCTSSNFVNPSGLYDKNHKTSSKDLALILKELIKYPEYLKIASTLTYEMAPNNKNPEIRYIWNKNKLILPSSEYYYKGALAGKTGYTTESQHSYVAAAQRDGQIMIVALVHDNTSDSYKDTIRLLDYGFNNFQTKNLLNKNSKLEDFTLNDGTSIKVLAGDNFFYTSNKNDTSIPTCNLKLNTDYINNNSLEVGAKIGTANIIKNGKSIGTVDILSGSEHKVKILSASMSLTSANKPSNNVHQFVFGAAAILLIVLSIKYKGLLSEKFYNKRSRL